MFCVCVCVCVCVFNKPMNILDICCLRVLCTEVRLTCVFPWAQVTVEGTTDSLG